MGVRVGTIGCGDTAGSQLAGYAAAARAKEDRVRAMEVICDAYAE